MKIYKQLFWIICVLGLASCSTTDETSLPVPPNVLTSDAEVKAEIVGKRYIEFSNKLQINMISTFDVDGNWVQSPPNRKPATILVSYRADGRVCNRRNKFCFYVRPTAVGFDIVRKDGSVGKSLKLAN